MIFSLDTNVMVDLVNGLKPGVRARYDAAVDSGARLVTCAVAAHELIYGALISRRPDVQRASVEALLGQLEIAEFTHADGISAAQIKAGLRRRGLSIGEHDLLIAGQAFNRGWSVVSANLRHFLRVDTLDVHDWTEAAT